MDNQSFLKQFSNPPNWFTFASILCGIGSIIISGDAATPEAFYKAGLMIVFAGLFDLLDGRVARMTGTGSEFGVQLDSLADVVSFGVAPTILVYKWALIDLGPFGTAVAGAFIICGIMRLARFNIKAEGGEKVVSLGLTITAAGGLLAAMVMTHTALGNTTVQNPMSPALLIVALCGLMLSEVPYRLLAQLRRSKAGIALVATLLVTGLGVGLKYDVAIFLFGFGFIYVATGPLLMIRDNGSTLTEPRSDSDK